MNTAEVFTINHGTKVIFGNNSSEKLGAALREYGATKVMFIYDPIMGKLGHADKLKKIMTDEGLEIAEFSGIVGEPTAAMVDEAATIARDFGANAVVGFGGGSSCDVAKSVGLLLANDGSILRYVREAKDKPVIKPFSPVVLLPTTAGTSADITPQAVLADANGNKTAVYHRGTLSIVDPQFTLALPASVTAVTGIDAMCHAIESFTNHAPNWMADVMDENAIKLIYKYLPRAYKDGSDLEARTMMSYAVALTGYGFADKSTTVGHAMANFISNKFHYAHGVGCALGLYVVLRYSVYDNPQKMLRIAAAIGIDMPGATTEEVGLAVVKAFDEFQKELGFKTLKEMGITEDFIEMLAKELPNNFRFKGSPYSPNFEYVTKALHDAFAL